MKINSISIVPQEVGCNYKCKYCIAHMTKGVREGSPRPGINLPKLEKCLKYAKDFGASTAIITSHGETLMGSWTNIENILWLCSKYFGQIDLHTNAAEILKLPKYGRGFSQMLAPYLSNITITVAHYDPKKNEELMGRTIDYERLFDTLNSLGLIIRLSCVTCKEGINSYEKMMDYLEFYHTLGVSQVVFRELWVPKNVDEDVFEWCFKNKIKQTEINEWLQELQTNNMDCKSLALWGNMPYDYNGLAVATSTCTQNNTQEVIKSVVYNYDNFLYPDWDSKCKIM